MLSCGIIRTNDAKTPKERHESLTASMNWFTTKRHYQHTETIEACRFKELLLWQPTISQHLRPRTILREMASPKATEKASQGFARIIRIWVERHRDRQELLNLLDKDHRIARDMRTTTQELMAWANKSFWLP
jgi:hypothetical protein